MSRRKNAQKTSAADSDLLEQVRMLTEENERLRALVSQATNNILTPKTNNENNSGRLIRVPAQTSTAIKPKINGKGCSCKGNCGSRVCGCVKKESACDEFCRCSNSLCQNQDPNKENNADPTNQAELTKEDEENIERLSRLNLKETQQSKQQVHGTPGPSNKRLEKVGKPRSIFSPDEHVNESNVQGSEIENFSLRFGNEATETETTLDNDQSDEPRQAATKKTMRMTRNAVKQKQGQENYRRPRIKSNDTERETIINDSETTGRNDMKNTQTQKKSRMKGKKSNSETKIQKKSGQKYKKNNERKIKNSIESDDGSDGDDSKVNSGKNTKKKMPVKKGKNNVLIEKKKNDTEDRRKSDEGSSSDMDIDQIDFETSIGEMSAGDENNIDSVLERNDKENPVVSKSNDHSDHESVKVKTEKEDALSSEDESSHDQSDNCATSPGSTSMQSNPGQEHNTLAPEANEEFNPMMPRRQLSRSPVISRNKSPSNQPSNMTLRKMHDPSERPLPVPVEEEPEAELLPPAELSQAVVDWNEHKQRLVHCRKCHRTFYRYRINKHEQNCQNV